MNLVEPLGLLLQDSLMNLDAGGPQPDHAAAADLGIGIARGDDHPDDAAGDDLLCARGGLLAREGDAGLQIDVELGALGCCAGPPESQGFSMGSAVSPVKIGRASCRERV